MKQLMRLLLLIACIPAAAHAIDACKPLPATIQVLRTSRQCGSVPTVVLRDKWKNSFSAAFRWEDGTDEGQDRNPFDLDNSSAASSPYKMQRRIRKSDRDFLCYGKFVNRQGYPEPVQLTIKRTVLPRVNRFCVSFD